MHQPGLCQPDGGGFNHCTGHGNEGIHLEVRVVECMEVVSN